MALDPIPEVIGWMTSGEYTLDRSPLHRSTRSSSTLKLLFYSVPNTLTPPQYRLLLCLSKGGFWLVYPFMSVKAVWAGLKQSTRVCSAVDWAPRQTGTGADSCTSAAAPTLLTEDVLSVRVEYCCCSVWQSESEYIQNTIHSGHF